LPKTNAYVLFNQAIQLINIFIILVNAGLIAEAACRYFNGFTALALTDLMFNQQKSNSFFYRKVLKLFLIRSFSASFKRAKSV
jgi:hypothetical protein